MNSFTPENNKTSTGLLKHDITKNQAILAGNFNKLLNKQFCFTILVFATMLACLSSCNLDWTKQNNPQVTFDVNITVPTIPAPQAQSPTALQINFPLNQDSVLAAKTYADKNHEYQQKVPTYALRLHDQNIDLKEKISITPHVEGNWTIIGDSIVLQPNSHWPANVTYELTFSDELFMEDVVREGKQYQFTTKGLTVEATESKLYFDPTKPGEQRYVSTLQFSHSINAEKLSAYYTLSIPGSTTEKRMLQYTITEDKETHLKNRVFYINSENITLTSENQFLTASISDEFGHVALDHKTQAQTKANNTRMLTERIEIPSADTLFHVDQTEVQLVRDDKNRPQKALAVHFTSATSLDEIRQHLSLKLLPIKFVDEQRQWLNSAEQLTANMNSTLVNIPFSVLPTANPESKTFVLLFDAPANQQMVIRVKKGIRATAGYISNRDYAALHTPPKFPTEIAFLGSGNILDSNGTHQIGLATRNISKIELKIGRISKEDLHHLVSQTGGKFTDTDFRGSLGIDDIAVMFEKTLLINNTKPTEKTYSSYDLTKHLLTKNESQGVFLIHAMGTNTSDGDTATATRMVLITDIGFIVKNNNDQSRDIFAQRISAKSPLNGALVSILGRNGRPVFETTTDELGHAVVPDLSSFDNERSPVAIVVTKGADFNYLPTQDAQHRVNYSRYEIGGRVLAPKDNNALSAYVFTDRGIYRPGESVHFAAIVRDTKLRTTKRFNALFTVSDPLGTTVYQESHLLPDDGFLDISLDTTREFKTGVYTAALSIHTNQREHKNLGFVEFSVEEFLPDRLKINTAIHDSIISARSNASPNGSIAQGWLTEDELKFKVSLNNLFGTAAQNRKISARFRVDQTPFKLQNHPDFHFSDVITQTAPLNVRDHTELPVDNTDKAGQSDVNIDLDNYFGGTYRLKLHTQGFEQDGGRSVHSENTVRYSPRDYLIGYKSKNLNYLKSGESHSTELICVDKYAQAKICRMQLNVLELSYVSTLVKQANGTYQYQTIENKHERSSNAITLGTSGYSHQLDTDKPGTYSLEIRDSLGELRQRLKYVVIGDHDLEDKLDADTRLELSLDKSEYNAGEWIELQIKAPYIGSGLISIESDRTHEFKWFDATTKQSVQRIQVPEGLQGNAYVQVAFIRSPSSSEIFTTPLSYSVAPFNLSKDKHLMELNISTPETVKPGESLTISYHSSQPGRSLIIAVDDGILQAANYVNPDPLAFFLQKRALQVETQQMFDLLLPEFSVLQSLSASGGDMDSVAKITQGSNLNPFAREVQDAVAFWSGIVQTDQKPRSLEFKIPDHFDGTLRVMSVALNERQFARAHNKVLVKGPFVVTPSLPLVVAPGDTFIANVGVSNQIAYTNNPSAVDLDIHTGAFFEVIGKATQTKLIRQGDEHTFSFKLRAKDHLGSAQVQFTAHTSNPANNTLFERKATNTISVRPATLLQNSLTSGKSISKNTVIKSERSLLAHSSTVKMVASANPALLIDGLISYLNISAHACTEQIVSKLFPVLAYHNHPTFLGNPASKQQQIETLFTTLRARQRPNGGFALWPGQSYAAEVPTVHVLHALIDAEAAGITIPGDLVNNGDTYLREFANDPVNMEQRPELSAYALYLLTRRGESTNNALIQLQSILQQQHSEEQSNHWQEQLVAAYIASSFKLLHRDDDAHALINQYKFKKTRPSVDHYDSALYRDSMAIYLLARHFKSQFSSEDAQRIEAIVEPIFKGAINTLSSGRALIALKAYSGVTQNHNENVTFESSKSPKANNSDGSWGTVKTSNNNDFAMGKAANFDHDTTAFKFTSTDTLYYQLQQIGYDLEPPRLAKTHGLEITKQILSANGNALSDKLSHGEDVLIRIQARSTDGQYHNAIAIVDLLPGGFEIDRQSVRDFQHYDADYIDVREDRLVVYTSLGPDTIDITYKARLTTVGAFTVPAAYANAMYNDNVYAYSSASTVAVQDEI